MILVRTDLKMPKGKIANQCCHASIGAIREIHNDIIDDWINNYKQTKIILKVPDLETIKELNDKCIKNKLSPFLVLNLTNDKWQNLITCMGVGPANNEVLDKIFKDLKLL